MLSGNVSCKVGDVKACGRAARWSTPENTKSETGKTTIRADGLSLTSWPVYLSWLWRLLPKHLKLGRRCGLIASRLPAVNQHDRGEAEQSRTVKLLMSPFSTQESAQQRSQTYLLRNEGWRKTWEPVLIPREEEWKIKLQMKMFTQQIHSSFYP